MTFTEEEEDTFDKFLDRKRNQNQTILTGDSNLYSTDENSESYTESLDESFS